MANLVIVESPGKVKTIEKYLNNNALLVNKYGNFQVMASVGHIRDLKKKKLGIKVESGFEPEYEFSSDKKKIISSLIQKSTKAKCVYLASDNDKEGVFIAESLRIALKLGDNYKRIIFSEISAKALEYAIENPSKIDKQQLDAQIARRTLDRLVGYKITPLLWKTFSNSDMSAGRVQSALVHLIIQKDDEIRSQQPSQYWMFVVNLKRVYDVKVYKDDNIYKETDQKKAQDFLKGITFQFIVNGVSVKEVKQKPPLPFITSSLQQESSFPINHTRRIAQELYEAGYITYMRTDSFNMSDDFKNELRKYIIGTYGKAYIGDLSDIKKTKMIQGAHECIRPVSIERLTTGLGSDHDKLYNLIWKRTVSSLMKCCLIDELRICFRDSSFSESFQFIAIVRKTKFNGYLKIYGIDSDNYVFSTSDKYDVKCDTIQAKNNWKIPSLRYNEVGLVKLMESENIGRPSTYSSAIQKIIEKGYVKKSNYEGDEKSTVDYILKCGKKELEVKRGNVMYGKETNVFIATTIGKQIDTFLSKYFDYIIDKKFTANMEAELDRIENGDKTRLDVLSSFWNPFSKDVSKEIIVENKNRHFFIINGIEYDIKNTKYGPTIQYGKTYIDLSNYLKYVQKSVSDIVQLDVEFMLGFPYKKNEQESIHIGRYGIYMKRNGSNIRMSEKDILDFVSSFKQK